MAPFDMAHLWIFQGPRQTYNFRVAVKKERDPEVSQMVS